MGSQVNFYMVPEDEDLFCAYVLKDPDVQVVTGMFPGSRFETLSVPLPPSGEPYAWCAALWNRRIISRNDIDNYHYCFIEFSRSVLQPDGLAPGRIWAEIEASILNEARKAEFRGWFRRVAGYLNSWPYRWDMYRIGPKTKEYFDKGGKALGYGLGEVKDIKTVGDVSVIHRGVLVNSFSPEIERDDGKVDP